MLDDKDRRFSFTKSFSKFIFTSLEGLPISPGKPELWQEGTGIWKEMLQKDHANRMVLDDNERGTLHKSPARKKSTPGSDTEETATVWTFLIEWLIVER